LRKARQYRGGYESPGLKELTRELRKNETSAESLLWARLRNRQLRGSKFRRQHQFGDYVADFYCRESSLVIECDGGVHQANEQWHHDQNRDQYLIAQGLRVLRFTNNQIFNNMESVLEGIANYLGPVSGQRDND
jgi:very-short-patch-repair endonuclease